METELKHLITKIQDEGVRVAEKRATTILQEAEQKKQELLTQAREEAAAIVRKAEQDAKRLQDSGDAALKLAARDLMLSVRKELVALFDTTIRQSVTEALTPVNLAEILATLVRNWPGADSDDLLVLVPEKDRNALEKEMQSRFAAALSRGVTIQPVKGLNAGFRIGSKDGAAFFDVSAGTLADLLSAYLNPRLAELMRDAESR
jgi:V/A-type H+-transporting ATPase subunit E